MLAKIAFVASLLATAAAATGCAMASAPVIPPAAAIQNYQAPLDIDNHETQLGAKRGTASTYAVLGLVSWGDGSTRAAAAEGGLTTIRTADYEFFTVFGLYSRYTTVVYGD